MGILIVTVNIHQHEQGAKSVLCISTLHIVTATIKVIKVLILLFSDVCNTCLVRWLIHTELG